MINQRLLRFGDFEVDRHAVSDTQLLMLLIAIDPTEKQKQVLDAFNIKIYDFNGKCIYPSTENLNVIKKQ